MIQPSIGRVVWFTPASNDWQLPRGDQPLAAIVAYVHSDTCVNLAVFDANGATVSRMSVPLMQDDMGINPEAAFAEWMPFQKGQAAKTDADAVRVREAAINFVGLLVNRDVPTALDEAKSIERFIATGATKEQS